MSQTEKEDKLILSRAEDAVDIAERSYQIKTVGFLNPHQRSLIVKKVYSSNDINVSFNGGYEDAERCMMICCPQYVDINIDEIIHVIRIKGRDVGKLNHRDYLGSLMGLGITRENIGDILCVDDGAIVFVKKDIASFIMQNLEKIGRHGIKTEQYLSPHGTYIAHMQFFLSLRRIWGADITVRLKNFLKIINSL